MNMKFLSTAMAIFFTFFGGIAHADIIQSAERFWSFDGTYNDSISNTLGTSAGGASFGNDRDGNANGALVLDGYNDRVLVDASTDLGIFNEYTLSLWFNMKQHNPWGRTYLFDSRAPGSTSNSYIFIDKNGSTSENLYSFNNFTSHNSLDNGDWHNLIFVNSTLAGKAKTYLDGVLITETASVGARNFNGGLSFGSYGLANTGGNYWLNGQLDDIGLWNRSLSTEEVSQVFNANASATNVPEPSTLAILALSMMGLVARRFKPCA